MKTFLNGLSLILPTALVLYIFVWILRTTENFFGNMILHVLPAEYYFSGLGFITGIAIVFAVGLLLRFWIVVKIRDLFEKLIDKTPIINALYSAMKDFFSFFSNLKSKEHDIVVLVDVPSLNSKIIGFITVQDLKRFDFLDMDDPVVVYFQLSYQIGGYSLFVSRKNITPIDMKIEDALSFVMTAGISNKNNAKNPLDD